MDALRRIGLETQASDQLLQKAEWLEKLASMVHQTELAQSLLEQAAEYRRLASS